MKPMLSWAAGVAALAALLALGLRALRERHAEAAGVRPEAPARIERNEAGEALVRLDRETVERAGLRTEPLAAAEVEPEVAGYGRLQEDPAAVFVLRAPVAGTLRAPEGRAWPAVGENLLEGTPAGAVEPRLAPAERIALMERLAATRAEAASAGAALTASKAAYQRARTLNADNKNVSDRALEEAEARLKGDEARAGAAAETVRLLKGSLHAPAAAPLALARGGQVVEVMAQPGEALESGQPLLRVVRFERLLARVEIPAGEVVVPDVVAARLVVLGREERPLRGERVAVTAAEPGTQGQSFLFRIHAQGLPLRPGLAVTAYLRAPGPRLKGVLVPRSAVVLAEARAWVYVRAAEGVFVRRAVTLERSLNGGWFVAAGLAVGDYVVTAGAQALLSEESKSLAGAGEEDEAH